MYHKLLEDFCDINLELTANEKDKMITNYKNLPNINDDDLESINFKDIF